MLRVRGSEIGRRESCQQLVLLNWARQRLRVPHMVYVDTEHNRGIKEFVVDQIIAVLDFFPTVHSIL